VDCTGAQALHTSEWYCHCWGFHKSSSAAPTFTTGDGKNFSLAHVSHSDGGVLLPFSFILKAIDNAPKINGGAIQTQDAGDNVARCSSADGAQSCDFWRAGIIQPSSDLTRWALLVWGYHKSGVTDVRLDPLSGSYHLYHEGGGGTGATRPFSFARDLGTSPTMPTVMVNGVTVALMPALNAVICPPS
jgi:hypothetical protein